MAKQKYGVKKSADPSTKYGKYVVFCTEPSPFHPTDDPNAFSMYLDERSVNGGFYWSAVTISKPMSQDHVPWKPHYHDHIEYVGLWGTNPDDKTDLGGEVEFWIGNEKFTVANTCVITIPAGVSHAPFIFKRVDRPIVFSSCSPAPVLYEHINRDPMWAHLPDPPDIDEVLD
jgi:hypothetical protein